MIDSINLNIKFLRKWSKEGIGWITLGFGQTSKFFFGIFVVGLGLSCSWQLPPGLTPPLLFQLVSFLGFKPIWFILLSNISYFMLCTPYSVYFIYLFLFWNNPMFIFLCTLVLLVFSPSFILFFMFLFIFIFIS